LINIGGLHLAKQLPRTRRHIFQETPLAFAMQRIKNQTALTAATKPCYHDHLIMGEIGIDAFEVMAACSSNVNIFLMLHKALECSTVVV